MKTAAIVAVVCTALLCFAQSRFSLLTPGEFHGNEVSAKSGERWVGLFDEPSGASWRLVTLRVTPFEDLDDDPGEHTGRRVAIVEEGTPVLLLKAPELLATVRVQSLQIRNRALSNGDAVDLSLGSAPYRLEVRNPKTPTGEISDGSELRLVNGTAVQTLYRLGDEVDGPDWSLIWAGDLDGDNKLDLFVNVSDHYNVEERILFLSTTAAAGRMVGEAGRRRTVGS